MQEIQVDEEDKDLLDENHPWKYDKRWKTLYRYVYWKKRQMRKEFLHRLVAARKKGVKSLTARSAVTFKDGNPYNCTRDNLVIQYRWKKKGKYLQHPDKSSQYPGVHWSNRDEVWVAKAYIPYRKPGKRRVQYKEKYLGSYKDEDVAGKAVRDFKQQQVGQKQE